MYALTVALHGHSILVKDPEDLVVFGCVKVPLTKLGAESKASHLGSANHRHSWFSLWSIGVVEGIPENNMYRESGSD